MTDRRGFLGIAAGLGAAALGGARPLLRAVPQDEDAARDGGRGRRRDAEDRDDRVLVTVPSGGKARHRIVDGVRVFHIVAEELLHAFAPGLRAICWGYDGHVNGPVIEAFEGERVRIYVTNRLPARTTIHWHGFILPNGMDGVSGLTQEPIPPGETFRYEFDLVQSGTHMFHSHHDGMTQIGLGLTGMFVVHPAEAQEPSVDRDFVLLLHEWHVPAGARRPNPIEMNDFNVLTMNGKVFPFLDALVARRGQRVRIRIGNLSAMDHHPIHLHGHEFFVTANDGQRLPEDRFEKRVTTLVGVGETRDIEFVAEHPGDWALHCHMSHHMMNQMGHDFANLVGFDATGFDAGVRSLLPGYVTMGTREMHDMTDGSMRIPENAIPMQEGKGGFQADVGLGGMSGVLKVRDEIGDDALARNEDPGWYDFPAGTVASRATPEELRRDGIDPKRSVDRRAATAPHSPRHESQGDHEHGGDRD